MFEFFINDVVIFHRRNKMKRQQNVFHRHLHLEHEFLFVKERSLTLHIETKNRVMKAGDLVIIPAGLFHYAVIAENTNYYDRFVINFPNDIIPEYLAKKINKEEIVCRNIDDCLNSLELLETYYQKYNPEEFFILAKGILNKLLIQAFNEDKKDFSESNNTLTKILKYIDHNIEIDITLDDLCKKFHYSKSHINNLFKEQMKCTPMKYIRQKKIMYAHHLILSGERKNIAAKKAGFSDYSTFFRSYKDIAKIPTSSIELAEPSEKNKDF